MYFAADINPKFYHLNLFKLVLTVVFLLQMAAFCQQPSHFTLGKDELASIDIYSLLQDKKRNYWISTNNGVYKYDGYDFKKIECDDMKTNSSFQLITDYNDNVFFMNLSGQIFKIENDSCSLYFELPKELSTEYFSFNFDNNNVLTISTSQIFQVDRDKNVIFSDTSTTVNYSIGHLYRAPDSTLMAFNFFLGIKLEIKDKKSTLTNIPAADQVGDCLFLHDTLVLFERFTGKIINRPSHQSVVKKDIPLISMWSDNEKLWLSQTGGGLYITHLKNGAPKIGQKLFSENVISALLKDNEGNILLGTFGDGIIVIPNDKINDLKFENDQVKISKVTRVKNEIYLGAQNGQVYIVDSLDNALKTPFKSTTNIELLEYIQENNSLMINYPVLSLINLKTHQRVDKPFGSVKWVQNISLDEYIVACNNGLYLYHLNENAKYDTLGISSTSNKDIFKLNHFDERTYYASYDTINKIIYSGTAVGLKMGYVDSAFFYEFNNQTIICHGAFYLNQKTYVATGKHGVLVFDGFNLIDQWDSNNILSTNEIRRCKSFNNNLYVSTQNGLQIISPEGKVIKNINKSDGLNSVALMDYEDINGILWTVTNKGVQKIDLNTLSTTVFKPKLELSTLIVNDIESDTSIHNYSHDKNRFVFNVRSTSLKYKDDIFYVYQLKGLDKVWTENKYKDHIITYKSLPPGSYTFQIKAIYKSGESNTLTYPFKIRQVFWKTWWFLSLAIVCFLLGILVIYKYQIEKQRRQQKIEKEIIGSKLTAIQSQMNPHFIFNALNSIQDLVIQQKSENAFTYISKFALLVRKILNHSDQDFIAVEEELELLKVYLELEDLRFKTDFVFSIENDCDPDIEIPPMLIQPFVENAIKHGLLHKKGEKKITIKFEMAENILSCTIIDNGIGRENSNAIKLRQNRGYDSFSGNAIKNRFEILKQLYGSKLGLQYVDLNDENGPLGTKVILKIPFKHCF